jgi:hypothetical protein
VLDDPNVPTDARHTPSPPKPGDHPCRRDDSGGHGHDERHLVDKPRPAAEASKIEWAVQRDGRPFRWRHQNQGRNEHDRHCGEHGHVPAPAWPRQRAVGGEQQDQVVAHDADDDGRRDVPDDRTRPDCGGPDRPVVGIGHEHARGFQAQAERQQQPADRVARPTAGDDRTDRRDPERSEHRREGVRGQHDQLRPARPAQHLVEDHDRGRADQRQAPQHPGQVDQPPRPVDLSTRRCQLRVRLWLVAAAANSSWRVRTSGHPPSAGHPDLNDGVHASPCGSSTNMTGQPQQQRYGAASVRWLDAIRRRRRASCGRQPMQAAEEVVSEPAGVVVTLHDRAATR